MSQTSFRKRVSPALITLLLFAALLAGCAPAASTTESAPASGESTASEAASAAGGDLTIGLAIEPITLDPALVLYIPDNLIARNIYDTLVNVDGSGALTAGLATEWSVNDAGTEFTFTLRDDVTFHDGTPFNADAVKVALDRAAAVTEISSAQTAISDYVSTEVVDAQNVVVTFSSAKPRFLQDLATGAFGIPSPTAVESGDIAQNPVGTGPFTFVEWVPQDHITIARNADYAWAPPFAENQGAPYLDTVTFRFLPEQGSRLSALQSGEAQVVEDPAAQEVAPLLAEGTYVLQSFSAPGMPSQMMINVEKAPTDDLAVRQAMLQAVNQEELVQVAFAGLQSAAHSVLSPSTIGYSAAAAELNRFDLENAKALLEGAGWVDSDGDGIREKDGEKLTLVYPAIPAYEEAFMELLAAYLTAVGFDVQIQTMDDAGVFEFANAGEHNIVNMGWMSSDPGVLDILFNSANIEGGSAFSRFRSEELDTALNSAAVEMDLDARNALYGEAQQIIMENALTLPVHNYDRVNVMLPSVQGWSVDADGYTWFGSVSLAQ